MATSGTIQQAIRTGYRLQIAWNVDSQSVANNTSTVTAKVQLVSTGSSYNIVASATKSGSLTINGTKYNFTFNASLNGNQTKTLYTKTVTVAHAANGTKTCSFSTTCGINVTLAGNYYGNVTASGSGVFNTIARASTISSVTSSVSVNGTNAVTVNIARASSGFTHTVVFSFGSYSKTTTGVGTSTSYAIPQSWLNAIPNATSGTAKVTVTTYSGSTKVGSAVSKNFTLTVPSSVVPTISGVTLSEGTSGIAAQFGAYVQGKSRLSARITAAGALSSTIKTYKTVVQGVTFTGASITSGIMMHSGTSNVTITVTDSRGRTASTTRSITVVAYTAPKITTFQGFRSLANGTENYDGTFLNANVNFSISSVGNKNTKSHKLEYKLKNATTWTTLTSGSVYALNQSIVSSSGFMSADSSYDIRLTVSDFFTTVTSTIEIPTAFTLLDFHSSGTGLAFGKVAEQVDTMEIALQTMFSHAETPSSPIDLQTGQDLNDVKTPGFYTLPSTAVAGTILNKPYDDAATGSLLVVKGGATDQVIQILCRTSRDFGGIFERSFYSDIWGTWQVVHSGKPRLLWSGVYYMNDSHVVNLSEKVSQQRSGIVLVFSRYDTTTGTVGDYSFVSHFVSKEFVRLMSGKGTVFMLCSTPKFTMMASKYLYISDQKIHGHADNTAVGTSGTGISYQNNQFVLRYVIGV